MFLDESAFFILPFLSEVGPVNDTLGKSTCGRGLVDNAIQFF